VAAEVLFHDRQNGELIPFQTETLLMRGSAHLQPLAGRRVLDRARAHIGLMHLPMWDIDAAGRELEWARSIGLRGLNFASPSPTSSPITTRSGTLSSQPARI
jgi:diadenosine tetraphosphatase ApaH/serine/threonine PP2A family protein phosphatase